MCVFSSFLESSCLQRSRKTFYNAFATVAEISLAQLIFRDRRNTVHVNPDNKLRFYKERFEKAYLRPFSIKTAVVQVRSSSGENAFENNTWQLLSAPTTISALLLSN